MADRDRDASHNHFAPTRPGETTALTLRDAVLERIKVRIPPGPSGLVGFAFLHSGQQVIPFQAGVWIRTDDELSIGARKTTQPAINGRSAPTTLTCISIRCCCGCISGKSPSTLPSAGVPLAIVELSPVEVLE